MLEYTLFAGLLFGLYFSLAALGLNLVFGVYDWGRTPSQHGARPHDPAPHRARCLAVWRLGQRPQRDGGDVDSQVDAIAKGTGHAVLIASDLWRRAAARPGCRTQEAARARIHRRHQHEVRRECQ